jgi:hypothetical protein
MSTPLTSRRSPSACEPSCCGCAVAMSLLILLSDRPPAGRAQQLFSCGNGVQVASGRASRVLTVLRRLASQLHLHHFDLLCTSHWLLTCAGHHLLKVLHCRHAGMPASGATQQRWLRLQPRGQRPMGCMRWCTTIMTRPWHASAITRRHAVFRTCSCPPGSCTASGKM